MFLTYFPVISPIIFIIIVTVLGFITPGYSHINYTISRLAIEKYGWIQAFNMLQFAFGLELSGRQLTDSFKDRNSKRIIRSTFSICALIIFLAAVFPTDPIENVPLDVTLLTPTGLVHISVAILFLALSPFGIVNLSRILKKQKHYRTLAPLTLITGLAALVSGIIWLTVYFMGILLEYRGIFQKAIALPVLAWLIVINIASLNKHRYHG